MDLESVAVSVHDSLFVSVIVASRVAVIELRLQEFTSVFVVVMVLLLPVQGAT
jgi:hypothetical protein